MKLRLDPWDAEYGAGFSGGDDVVGEETPEGVDLEAEAPAGEWGPVEPSQGAEIGEVCFVDGVRRLEARLSVEHGGVYGYGAMGSGAVGAVRLDGETAVFERLIVDRLLAVGLSELPEPVKLAAAATYRPIPANDPTADGPLQAIHNEMRKLEERLGRELAAAPERLVVADGPLTFAEPAHGNVVGYIKRVMRPYLPAAQLRVVAGLPSGARSPLFGLRSSQRFERLSWFLRLQAPRPGDSEFAGVVRLEVAAEAGAERARALADACCALLPPLSGRRGLDARAPQNLLPIAALENRLRRQMGDQRIARRRIEAWISREAGQAAFDARA